MISFMIKFKHSTGLVYMILDMQRAAPICDYLWFYEKYGYNYLKINFKFFNASSVLKFFKPCSTNDPIASLIF